MPAAISPDPWSRFGLTTTLDADADDAYVFGDIVSDGRLDAEATAVAVRSDQDRLAHPTGSHAFTGPSSDPRIGRAFASFVAIGPDGLACASLGLARGGESASVRLAYAALPLPSHVAMLAPAR